MIKRNEVRSHQEKNRKLKCVLLGKISLSEKTTICMIPNIGHSRKRKIKETLERSVIVKDLAGLW